MAYILLEWIGGWSPVGYPSLACAQVYASMDEARQDAWLVDKLDRGADDDPYEVPASWNPPNRFRIAHLELPPPGDAVEVFMVSSGLYSANVVHLYNDCRTIKRWRRYQGTKGRTDPLKFRATLSSTKRRWGTRHQAHIEGEEEPRHICQSCTRRGNPG